MTRRLAALALVAGCASQTPITTDAQGEGARVVTGTASAPSPVSTPARVKERIASRSRVQTPTPVTGTRIDVTCYAYTGNRTASGKWPQVGMAASNRYPFGTRLLVESVGVVTVEDRIGHGTDLDLYGPSESYCRHFGRKHLRVAVAR